MVGVGAEYGPDTNQYIAPWSIPQWSMLSNKWHRGFILVPAEGAVRPAEACSGHYIT
jgi:hypothetical protein